MSLLLRCLCLLPLLGAGYYVFINPPVHYVRRIDLRAPGGTVDCTIEHALVELRDRALMISGVPEPQQGRDRLQLLVRRSPRAVDIYDQILEQPTPDRFIVHAVVPAGAPKLLNVDSAWQTGFDTTSDYGSKVWHRLWVLLLGLVGSVALLQLITLARRGRLRSKR